MTLMSPPATVITAISTGFAPISFGITKMVGTEATGLIGTNAGSPIRKVD